MLFNVQWNVTEIINGPGQHDDGVVDGTRSIRARGEVQKEAISADFIRRELTAELTRVFPETGYGPTYNIERFYSIDIREL